MPSKPDPDRFKQDAFLYKQLTKEPGYQVFEAQLEGQEDSALKQLLQAGPKAFSDDYWKGFIAAIKFMRGLPALLDRHAETL